MDSARHRRWLALIATIVVAGGCAREPGSASDDDVTAGGQARSSSSAVAPAIGSAPTASPVAPTIVLAPDGLGVATFGSDADGTVAALTAVLGEPDDDSGWVDPLSIGACAGTEARFVAWGSLYAYFSDQSSAGDGARHFFGFSYGSERDLEANPEGLATPDGIGLGTTLAFLRAAHPGIVVEAGEEGLLAPSFYVDDRLSGRLTGAADDDLITVIIGGDPCGVGM